MQVRKVTEVRTVTGIVSESRGVIVRNRHVNCKSVKMVPLKSGKFSVRALGATEHLNKKTKSSTVHAHAGEVITVLVNGSLHVTGPASEVYTRLSNVAS